MTLVTPPSGPDFDVTDYEALAYYRREPGYVVHDGVSGPASTAPTLPLWAASTSYKAGQEIWISAGTVAVAQSTHLSGSTYAADKTAGKWVEVAGGGTSGAGLPATILTKTANYTAAAGDFVQGDVSSGGFTVTLPAAPSAGTLVAVKKIDASSNTLTIAPSGGGTIDGDANATTTTQWAGAVFEHVGSNVWRIAAAMQVTGPQGPAGAAGTINVGTVTTGAAGSSATVANSGSPTAAIFDFTIPRGNTGSTGAAGAIAQVQDEGSNVTVRGTLNFVGAGVTATDDAANSRTNVTVAATGGPPAVTGVGLYFAAYGTGVVSNLNQGQNWAYIAPIIIPVAMTVDRIGIHTPGTASGFARLGIYSDNGGVPGNLLLDAGQVDCSTAGFKEATISQVLAAGVYWPVAIPQGAATVVYGHSGPIGIPDATATNVSGQIAVGLASSGNSGVLPTTLTVSSRLTSTTPRIVFRRSV